ncbi:glycosyltransferase, partial [Lactococcus formosensis]|uniref:glycosyltransferase n=1 Tax=Lactococcus formosensis TaxID=1281486 RepID=UPI0022E7C8C5
MLNKKGNKKVEGALEVIDLSKLEKKNFFFSIIMAAYNVEPYIDDAINSLVRQSLNFTKNVELIIVNDGSTDNSIEKAKYWQSKYPENIFIIDQKNTGVSEARNVGIAKAKGKYINFLDPDDKLDYNVLLSVKKFFLKNKEIKIVHIPLKFFEARKGPHRLNKYFEKDVEIIYIDDDYKKIFAHISSSFIAKSILTEDETLRFERNRKYGEDLELIAKLVERERVFALINGNFYNYRVRTLKNSSMDFSRTDPDAYIPNLMMLLNLIYIHLEEGKLDKWLQTLILYDICWKIKREILPFEASEEFYSEYTTLLFHCLNYIDVSIIEESEFLRPFQINTLLFLKENKRFPLYCDEFSQKKLKENNQKFKKGELKVISTKIYITKYRRESNSFNITGIIDELFDDK